MDRLPVELIQNIGIHLSPDAIDPLTSTNKHIRRVLTPLIRRHRGLKSEFGHAICGEAGRHGLIAQLLIKVLRRPELHYYIRKLTIEDWSNDLTPDGTGERMIPAFHRQIHESSKDTAWLREQIATLSTDSGVFPFLLWELSELRELRLITEPPDESEFYEMLCEILDSEYRLLDTGFPPILRHLAKVELDEKLAEASWMIGTAKVFSLHPSMKELRVASLNEDTRDGWKTDFLARPSNVERLEFRQDCFVADKIMYNFLRGFPNLKTLYWQEIPLSGIGANETWESESEHRTRGLTDGFWLCLALQIHCRDSLESLTINSPVDHVAIFLGDLSGFRKLRYLATHSSGLCREIDNDQAVLPESLEMLDIECGRDKLDFVITCDFCTSLIGERAARNITLKRLVIDFQYWVDAGYSLSDEEAKTSYKKLKDHCQLHGVDLNVFRADEQ